MHLIQRFRETHPHCQVQVTDLSPASQVVAIQAGQLDGGFIGAQPTRPAKGIGFALWSREPLLLALPEKHALTKARVLRWSHLKGLTWVMVSRNAAPAFRQQFSELVEKHRLAARIVQESDRVPAILTMVAAGSGVTMVPQTVEHLISKGVRFRQLPPPRPFLQHTFAYCIRSVPRPLEDFLGLLKRMERRNPVG